MGYGIESYEETLLYVVQQEITVSWLYVWSEADKVISETFYNSLPNACAI